MFDWPMSSPQMMTMFGFLPAWAAPGRRGDHAGRQGGEESGTRGRPGAAILAVGTSTLRESGEPPGTAAVALPEKSRRPAAVA